MREGSSRKEELLTLETLRKQYYLSPKWIERLGPPDEEKPNPHFRRAGAPMKLWRKDRVEAFIKEHRLDSAEHLNQWALRSRRSKNAADKRRAETLDYARTIEIHLRDFPRNLKKACQDHLSDLGKVPEVTDVKVVNMLRHKYSNYHTLLDSLFGRVGRWEAYPIIKGRVNQAICQRANIALSAEIHTYSDDEFVAQRWGEAGTESKK